jgi:Ca2+/H+ antiporter, TMEM165/GDT1 family
VQASLSAVAQAEEKLKEAEESGRTSSRWRKAIERLLTPVFLEAFLLTFLGEWGDRRSL